MKNSISSIVVIVFIYICLFVTSCNDPLNVKPENIIQGGKQIFSDNSSIEAYMATLYSELPLQDFNYQVPSGGKNYMSSMAGVSINNAYRNRNSVGNGTWLSWWKSGYSSIRDVNNFLTQLKGADLSSDEKKKLHGEAQFLRAYYYFELVKRYGGVPLITKVQTYSGTSSLESLQVPRSTEKQIYDFISTQLDSAAQLMGTTSPGKGRANKYVADALKSRAMLYAASEAEYGTIQLNGVVGISADGANQYWKQAYDAAKKVINSDKYSLYNKYPDNKSKNFSQLFLDLDNNPEAIFVEHYYYPEKTHGWDQNGRPSGECGGHIDPTLEFVESFEYKNGSDGKLKLTDNQDNPIEYKTRSDLFNNKDPRFFATVNYPGAPWAFNAKSKIDIRAGIIDNGKTITSSGYDKLYKGMHIIGNIGIGGNKGNTPTGFYLRKYLLQTPPYQGNPPCGISSTHGWMVFRYGEILLNYAEAAMELDKSADAKKTVNKVRARAGMKLLTEGKVNRDAIRHEREVELAFEGGKRYWDIRRWHIADKLINNTQYTALYPYYIMDDDAYIFKTKKVGYSLTFYSRLYYQKIPDDEISKNPQLVQNPGY